MNIQMANEIMFLYQQMEAEANEYQKTTGLTCPPLCGKCCLNPQIEASPLELLPMALHIIHLGQDQEWLEKLECPEAFNLSPSSCPLYLANPLNPHQGRCQYYAYRPAVCRLFGAARHNAKNGGSNLSICKIFKENNPSAVEALQRDTDLKEKAPNIGQWIMKLSTLDPTLNTERRPIQESLKIILEKLLFLRSYSDPSASLAENSNPLNIFYSVGST